MESRGGVSPPVWEKEKMANKEQLAILKQGVDVWNRWREENPNVNIDLSEANLLRFDLNGVDFMVANLSKANLERTNLAHANLFVANLSNAVVQGAACDETDLRGTNLTEADFSESNLNFVNFEGAFLEKTNFTNASFTANVLGNHDLSTVIGLDTVTHHLRSTISPLTLVLSKGKISVEFLRGCGLSDLDIAYTKLAAPGLDPEQVSQIIYEIHNIYLDQPIQFYSVFISYSSKDEAFAQRLHDDLQNNGVRCWFAPEDLKIGDRIRPTIDHQIRMREKLIVIVSENSLQSEWVGDEVEAALEQERVSGKDVLFPIRLDDTVLNSRDDWGAKIKRRRNIGDFSKWKDDAEYQKMFEGLLKDLRASEE